MNEAVRRMLQRYDITSSEERKQALREILQEIALVGLWRAKFFEHAAFYGGTALRIFHGLDRFSEDLDFTLLKSSEDFCWAPFAQTIVEEIRSYDFNVELVEKKKSVDTAVRSAFLKTNTLQSLLKIGSSESSTRGIHPEAMLRIKVEVDTQPILGFRVKQHYLRDPIPVPVASVVESDLFAAKLHAALYRTWKKRVKGRDWYDFVWFTRRKIPLRLQYFSRCMQNFGLIKANKTLSLEETKGIIKKRLKTLDIAKAKDDVRPFLRHAAPIEEWSVDFFQYWIDQIVV